MISETPIYVNKDWTKIVPVDSPDAAFQMVSAGKEIPAKFLHLFDTEPVVDLSGLSKKELVALANERDVEHAKKATKADLIAALEA